MKPPVATNEAVRKTMQGNTKKDTSIELVLRSALWRRGVRFRKNVKSILGTPDIAIKKYHLVVFCDGDFWHGKDYHNIKQTESAEFMGISQSTFHRILNSARNKLATSLIEGRPIVIVKGDTMIDPNKYLCEDCGFQWSNPEKEYGECPDCKSTNIRKLNTNNRRNQMSNDTCSCPNCGYSEPKIRGVPCRTKKCPECGSPLQGRGLCNI